MIAARKIAMDLSESKASNEQVVNKVDKIIAEHGEHKPLSAAQKQTVIQFVERQIQKHQNSDKVERLIIDADDKNLYFMWGKIKRHCPVGDTIAWPHCSSCKGSPLFKDSYCSNHETAGITWCRNSYSSWQGWPQFWKSGYLSSRVIIIKVSIRSST